MGNRELNLFIVADHALVVNGLKHYLEDKFGTSLNIQRFYDSKSCLRHINKSTQAVVLDHSIEGRRGNDILKSIKSINPKTEGIFYSTTEQVAAYVQALLTKHQTHIPKEFRKLPELINNNQILN